MIQFKDAKDREWTPDYTTPIMMKISRKFGLTVQKVSTLDINLGDLIEMVWLCCESQAVERHVSQKDFLTAIDPAQAVNIVGQIFSEAFRKPGIETAAEDDGEGPDAEEGPALDPLPR